MWMVVVAVGIGLARLAGAAEVGPVEVVERLDTTLVGVIREAAALGYDGRVKRLAPAVDAAYDVPFMAEKSLGAGWKTLSDADRTRWVALSREFSVANYAANFDRGGTATIELLGDAPGGADTTMVRTRIVPATGDPVAMTYRLHQTADGWKIIDVYLKDTVSELALRRADYTSVLAREGFETLVATMRTRIADLAAGRGRRQGT